MKMKTLKYHAQLQMWRMGLSDWPGCQLLHRRQVEWKAPAGGFLFNCVEGAGNEVSARVDSTLRKVCLHVAVGMLRIILGDLRVPN